MFSFLFYYVTTLHLLPSSLLFLLLFYYLFPFLCSPSLTGSSRLGLLALSLLCFCSLSLRFALLYTYTVFRFLIIITCALPTRSHLLHPRNGSFSLSKTRALGETVRGEDEGQLSKSRFDQNHLLPSLLPPSFFSFRESVGPLSSQYSSYLIQSLTPLLVLVSSLSRLDMCGILGLLLHDPEAAYTSAAATEICEGLSLLQHR